MQPDHHKPHEWASPPPGQGSSNERVCRLCGVRRSVGKATPCPGIERNVTIEVKHEYDPFG